MNIVFIDTAEGTRVLVAVGDKYYYDENLKNAGAETLMPMIDALLKKAGISVSDVDLFGASIGPGSFTGLRVGLTTVRTLCYALDKPCFAVNNLRLISYNNSSDKVISIADAGNRVCYVAMFDGDKELKKTACMTTDDANKLIAAHPDFAVSTDLKLKDKFLGTAGIGEDEMKKAVATHSGQMCYRELEPLYVRKAQPERMAGDL